MENLSEDTLVYEKPSNPYTQRVVSIGGGTGQYSFLTGLRWYNNPDCITAIAGTWDDGGDSGRRRVDEGILPPGDARQCILALCEPGTQMEAAQPLFNYRDHREVSLGNEMISFYTRWAHGDQEGLDYFRKLLLIPSNILYVTSHDLRLYGETASQVILNGESEIDTRHTREDYNPDDKIVSLYFDTDAKIAPRARNAIISAQKIVFPSGSLYGSLLPHFLVDGVVDAILESEELGAKLIFVGNLMSERGQTDGYKVSDHLEPFMYYLGKPDRLDYIILHNNHLETEILTKYQVAGQHPIEMDEADEKRCRQLAPKAKIIRDSIASYTRRRHLYRHDHRLAKLTLDLK